MPRRASIRHSSRRPFHFLRCSRVFFSLSEKIVTLAGGNGSTNGSSRHAEKSFPRVRDVVIFLSCQGKATTSTVSCWDHGHCIASSHTQALAHEEEPAGWRNCARAIAVPFGHSCRAWLECRLDGWRRAFSRKSESPADSQRPTKSLALTTTKKDGSPIGIAAATRLASTSLDLTRGTVSESCHCHYCHDPHHQRRRGEIQ